MTTWSPFFVESLDASRTPPFREKRSAMTKSTRTAAANFKSVGARPSARYETKIW